MNTKEQAWTTASIEAVPRFDAAQDATPGLVIVYSRLYEQLPSAVALITSPTSIGRESDNTMSVPEAAVSRFHARVEQRGDAFFIFDNGSTNGTLVNGERVTEARLMAHDVVRIGDTIFRYAASAIYGYSAYRIDGSVIDQARPFKHQVVSAILVGGYQIDAILDRIAKVAVTGLSVVVTGESGTGKELVAKELHRESARQGPFQAINCAALPPNLIESELFGYRKGAFTGALSDKLGLVRAAHLGTLFLDEIGDMPLEAQAKLLRVLQEREVLPIGATTAEPVDVRVVCATHRDLDRHIADGRFRGDLLARLREARIEIPPLRERREDLYMLVRHFLARAGHADARVSFAYMLGLAHYDWPYNVRELESAVKLSVALAEGGELDLAHLPDNVKRALDGHGRPRPAGASRDAHHAQAGGVGGSDDSDDDGFVPGRPPPAGTPSEQSLRALLAKHRGNIAAVGRELGKERMQVHRWLKRYQIEIADYRE